ncbi:uncharacterized protein STEHIDRAFT_114518 [Stereum hirsutum FP-91666 SS1]|uniref:uncharacterized protein n=1 Tax=Stereum hirsutum (strain FP-91666) TaxID=721885 RepID=UPI000444A326|nr:uncharacterized protein STEHIDRAFT_114518 [Stereum hirsutum FP-91666 SS1]EIM81810.1 hypothetical protein STEHIDRAFT_114518 [Stereum hirsutum FP-91666 SS1]
MNPRFSNTLYPRTRPLGSRERVREAFTVSPYPRCFTAQHALLLAAPGAIKSCISDRELDWLNGSNAIVASVLEAMEEYNWCHLACHSIQDTKDPMKSKFALHGGALDLKIIMTKTFERAEMAFLSACQTETGDENRPEEAVHLAAAMLAAGYRTVYATMWSIGDKDGLVVAKEVYSYLLNRSDRGNGKEAYALHQAVATLRNNVGEEAFVKCFRSSISALEPV